MQDTIRVFLISKTKNSCTFKIVPDKKMKRFFKNEKFFIENGDINFENIPPSVLFIPVVLNLIPLVWLTNSRLYVDEIDFDLYRSLKDIKENFRILFNMKCIDGIIIPSYIIKNNRALKNSCSLFSGGVDAITTAFRHKDGIKKFISVWGADVSVENDISWNETWNDIKQQSEVLKIPSTCIKSNIKEIFEHDELNKLCDKVNDSYWHAAQHGLALIGLSSLVSYYYSYENVYISSSYTPDFDLLCASNPVFDGNVSFFGCQVIHDGFELNRLDKIHYLSKQVNKESSLRLKVCRQNQDGKNCCVCEKCLRTIIMICALGLNPELYGFHNYKEGLKKSYTFFNYATYDDFMVYNMNIAKNIILEKGTFYRELERIKSFDFEKVAKRNKTFLFKVYKKIKTRFLNGNNK